MSGPVTICLTVVLSLSGVERGSVYMADGIKIGEVRQDAAIVWTRLTKNEQRNIYGLEFGRTDEAVPVGHTLEEMEGSVPGATGEVRVVCWPKDSPDQSRATPWQAVDPEADFTRQFQLNGLAAGTRYHLKVEGRPASGAEPSCTLSGGFETAPQATTVARVAFAVVTCQEYPLRDDLQNGHRIYPLMQKLEPDFFVHTGDIEYYDRPRPYAKSRELARFKWNRIFAMPFQRRFHENVASYFMKDDHDTLRDDAWPGLRYGDLTWEQGLAIFREQVPMGESTYRTVRWGKDLQIWMVEGRDFRTPNRQPDGPAKTIWGRKQKEWFFQTVKQSDATFRILISPTPLVGPDRANKNDSYANKGFTCEGDEIRKFLGAQKNMYVICGDRHWQYVSVDPKTGVREYACGPSSDAHAGGFNESLRTDMHRYLRIKGGFLLVTVERTEGKPAITFRHYGTDGTIYHEDRLAAQ
ncbi:MAG: alkaline phosphatase D family protein [Planctomycetes bacterium]|nr:alkaline phosphatase D family protein [Planctomycetota bacterium]